MSQLIKHGRVVNDPFLAVADGVLLPDAPVLVSRNRWREERDSLRRHGHPVGVRLANTDSVAELADDLPQLALVALEFPAFPDGRAYSQARLLRDRFGFGGELRATGAVVLDQLAEMTRCGFDALEISDGVALESVHAILQRVSVDYQPWLRTA